MRNDKWQKIQKPFVLEQKQTFSDSTYPLNSEMAEANKFNDSKVIVIVFFIITVIIFDCYLEACLIAGRFGSQF